MKRLSRILLAAAIVAVSVSGVTETASAAKASCGGFVGGYREQVCTFKYTGAPLRVAANFVGQDPYLGMRPDIPTGVCIPQQPLAPYGWCLYLGEPEVELRATALTVQVSTTSGQVLFSCTATQGRFCVMTKQPALPKGTKLQCIAKPGISWFAHGWFRCSTGT